MTSASAFVVVVRDLLLLTSTFPRRRRPLFLVVMNAAAFHTTPPISSFPTPYSLPLINNVKKKKNSRHALPLTSTTTTTTCITTTTQPKLISPVINNHFQIHSPPLLTSNSAAFFIPRHHRRPATGARLLSTYYSTPSNSIIFSRPLSHIPRAGTRTPIVNTTKGGGAAAGITTANTLLTQNNNDTPPKPKQKKQPTTNKKKKSNLSPTDAAPDHLPTESANISQPKKKTKNNTKTQQSLTSLEVDSTSTTLVDTSGASLIKDVQTKTKRKPKAKKPKPVKTEANKSLPPDLDGKTSSSVIVKTIMSRGQKNWPQLYPPMGKSVLVVESATKAKVIQAYLGDMFEVLPSYGHVRDLAARSGSVRPDDDFSMVWEVPSAAWSHLKSIKVALNGAQNLILASDPDREGEAIAWHVIEMLEQQDALPEHISVARVVFNEITESSIKSALLAPREIDANLVHAYLARRALDYLIGFNVSPLLWRKLPGCQSAGRVQSAALALICDREKEIDEFKPQEYWTIDVHFKEKYSNKHIYVPSHLTHYDSNKLNQLSISSSIQAKDIEQKINLSDFEVVSSKPSKTRKNPPMPFITSSLQQDAANKFNFTASHTMKIAQKLYEGVQLSDGMATGLITYMRTDGLHLSDEAAKDIQSFIREKYGHNFASTTPRKFFKKVKNAQEAHEAIRPTDIRRLPTKLVKALDEDSLKLYSLIWSRTMACQMEPAVMEHIQLDFGNTDRSTMLRSTCSRVEFRGYQAVYEDVEKTFGVTKRSEDEQNHRNELFSVLSNLKEGQPLRLAKVELDQHHTQPPARYNEGSLVKKLEELGIGRPSTYASTIKVLKDRNYITVKSRTLYPEFRGRMVSAFLSNHFSEVTDYSFTADMETELDNVSAGMTEWKGLLNDYWTRFSKYCERAKGVHIHQVEKMLEKTFGDSLFASLPDGNRTCPSCQTGTMVFKVSRFGAGYFIGCDGHPKCKYIAKTLYGEDDEGTTPEDQKNNMQEPKLLGLHPGSNEKVLLKSGPYGYYVQLGEDRKGHCPKRASVAQIKNKEAITLEDALDLLQYPVTLGNHPDDNKPVLLKLAKVGFSIKHTRSVATLPKNIKPKELTLEKAVELLNGDNVRRSGRPTQKEKLIKAL